MPQTSSSSNQTRQTEGQGSLQWSLILQLGLSLTGTLALWGFALTLLLTAINAFIDMPDMAGDFLSLLLISAGFAFVGLLLIPSAVLALLQLLGRSVPIEVRLPRAGILFLILPVFIGSGYLVAKNTYLVWVLLPPIHVIAIGIAVLWMITLGIRGLPLGTARRQWGIFSTGLVVAPVLSLILEFIVIVAVSIIGIAYLGRDPAFSTALSQIYERYMANPELPLDFIVEMLQPFLMQPVVVYGGLVLVALLVPLIEEFIKPIGVWLLAGSQPTPAQGFAAGVLSGAGFALFENLVLSANSGEEWAMIVIARIGTSFIHILTTGLTGYALAMAWGQKKYLRLGAAYLIAVAIHALWNGLVVLSVVPELLPELSDYPEFLKNIGLVSPFGFLVLLAGSFILLLVCNITLKRAIIPPVVTAENETVSASQQLAE